MFPKFSIVLIISAVAVGLLVGCPKEAAPPSDGTITVRVTAADTHNSAFFYYAVGNAGADLSNPDNWIGVAPTSPTIASGTVECVTVVYGGAGEEAIFAGGNSYDASGIIDVDLSGSMTSGDYSFADTVIVDGDTILSLVYPTDFVVVP